MAKTTRIISEQDLAIARNMKGVWATAQARMELSQASAAKLLGVSQSAFSQFLNGKVPVSLDFVMNFCHLFRVPLKRVSPSYAALLRDNQSVEEAGQCRLPHLSLLHPAMIQGVDQVLVDSNDFAPRYYAGDRLRVAQDTTGPQVGIDYLLVGEKATEVIRVSGYQEPTFTYVLYDQYCEGHNEMSMEKWGGSSPLIVLSRH